jgi:hypothetical protein
LRRRSERVQQDDPLLAVGDPLEETSRTEARASGDEDYRRSANVNNESTLAAQSKPFGDLLDADRDRGSTRAI